MGPTTSTGHVLDGRYRLLEVIGQGGMAVVYRAQDALLGRDVAVKVLRPAFASDEAFVERFRREARNAASLHDPNIVTIHDTGVDAVGGDFIVMSLVEGPDLQRVLARDGPLPVGFAVRIGIETARALEVAHEHGIVHRDIKPGNILIGPNGGVRVADFGIARAASDIGATTSGAILGSAQYASPEQVAGEPVSPRSDIYSPRIVLYEALTGVRPFDGPNPAAVALERLRVPPRPLRELRPDLPASLDAIVMRALERDPEARYPSAAEFAGELQRFRDSELGGIRRPGIGARAVRARAAASVAAPSLAGEAVPVAPAAWVDDDTQVERAAPLRARTRRRRRRALAPVGIAAGLGLAALSLFVLVTTASLLGSGIHGGALGETSSARPSDLAVAAATATPTPSPSPTVSPTPSPTASPTPSPTASPSPRPTDRPTARPTPRPTPRPTQRPVAGATFPARDPAETVRLFYDLVERHEFDAAARLWTRRMREQYPPAGYIDGRFAATTSIDIDRLRIERISLRTGTALVSVAITEYRSSGPSPRYFSGTWELVLTDAGWLMDRPHF